MEYTISIKLTLNDINAVLRVLGNRPYAEVANLIDDIRGQAQAALHSEEEADATATFEADATATFEADTNCDREG